MVLLTLYDLRMHDLSVLSNDDSQLLPILVFENTGSEGLREQLVRGVVCTR